MALTGSEKQIAWAESIIEDRKGLVGRLEEAIEILSDMSQYEEVDSDPLFPDEDLVILRYTKNLQAEHQAALHAASPWWPDGGPQKDQLPGTREARLWAESLDEEAKGVPHAARKGELKVYAATLEDLKRALETETDAKYWIDRR